MNRRAAIGWLSGALAGLVITKSIKAQPTVDLRPTYRPYEHGIPEEALSALHEEVDLAWQHVPDRGWGRFSYEDRVLTFRAIMTASEVGFSFEVLPTDSWASLVNVTRYCAAQLATSRGITARPGFLSTKRAGKIWIWTKNLA